jgi:hypothetical protein
MTIDSFKTPLGTVELGLRYDGDYDIQQEGSNYNVQTGHFSVEVIAFDNIRQWMENTLYTVESSKGWIVRIVSKTENAVPLAITCELKTDDPKVTSLPDSGANLDSVWIENKTHFLSIGTEDGLVLKRRAEKEDYMPSRFADVLGNWPPQYSFTQYTKLGFITVLPPLLAGDKFYFHYLAATNPRKKSKEHPQSNDISTTVAVDFPKKRLVTRLRIKE